MPNDLNTVDAMETYGGTTRGYISSRLMAAYDLDGAHIIHVSREGCNGGRVQWSYVLEHDGKVIFEGADFSTAVGATYGEAAVGVLGFLTLRPGDTDSEYFDSYTDAQVAWRDEHAEDLAMFAMEYEGEEG
jgi:hypothetical protein